jgi:hypothetical protein
MESCDRSGIAQNQNIGAGSHRKSLSTFSEPALIGAMTTRRQTKNAGVEPAFVVEEAVVSA